MIQPQTKQPKESYFSRFLQTVDASIQESERLRKQQYVERGEQILKLEQERRNRARNKTNQDEQLENATQVKADTIVQPKKMTNDSTLLAESQARTKQQEKKNDKKEGGEKKKSSKLLSWEENMDKWAPSWRNRKNAFENIVKQTEEDIHKETAVATANGIEMSSRASQAKAVTNELNKLKEDYDKRIKFLQQKKEALSNSATLHKASIYTSSPTKSQEAELNKVNQQIEQLQDEYATKAEMIRKYTSRGGIAADSFGKLADERFKDEIALTEKLSKQHQAMLNDPNADPEETKALGTKVNAMINRNEARKQKLDIIEKYIKAHGLPKSIEELPKHVQDVAAEVFSEGGVLNNGVLAPSDVSEIGKRIREFSEQSNQLGPQTQLHAEEQARSLREQTLNELRMIEEAHGISKGWADFENASQNGDIFSVDNALGTLAHDLRSTLPGWINSAVFQGRLGQDRERYNTLVESLHTVDKALRYQAINDELFKQSDSKRQWNKNEFGNLLNSFVRTATDSSIWDFGISDLKKAAMLNDMRAVQDNGGEYTNAQKDMLNAMALDAVLHDKYGEYEEAWGVKAGETFAQSLPFMLDMMIGSHGLASLGKATEKQGVKGVAKFLSGEVGKTMQKQALREAIEQYGVHGVKAALARNIKQAPGLFTRLSGDAVNSLLLANTIQGAKTVSDIMDLHTGLVDYKIGENGTVTGTGFKNALSWEEAIRQAETRAWIENFSEALGEYDIFTNMFKPIGRQFVKLNRFTKSKQALTGVLGVDVVAKKAIHGARIAKNFVDNHNPFAGEKIRGFLHAAKYHGLVGESLEEYYGMALEHAFDVSDSGKSFWQQITDPDTFWDVVGGIALSQVVLGTAG